MKFWVNYWGKLKAIQRNCKLLLGFLFITSTSGAITTLLLNLYLAATGFSKENIALFNSVNFLASGLMAIPLAIILENVPRKYPFILSALVFTSCYLGVCFASNFALILILAFFIGASNSIFNVLVLPFLTEHSSENERVHLFSVFSAQGWASNMLGSLIGGFMPSFLSSLAIGSGLAGQYRVSMVLAVSLAMISIGILFLIKEKPKMKPEEEKGESLHWLPEFKGAMWKFLLVEILIFLGAGLFMPFMNLYFATVHKANSGLIGIVFTISSGIALLGTLVSPLLAEKVGKIKAIFLCQAIAIPLLVALAFASNFYLASLLYVFRLALMNMANPLMDSFGMEIVPPHRRATFASLMRSTQPFAWAAMGPIAGRIMETGGFMPLFFLAASLYTLSSFALLFFFAPRKSSLKTPKLNNSSQG